MPRGLHINDHGESPDAQKMADEDEVVEPDTSADEEDADTEDESEEADSSSSKEEKPDYEAILAAEKERADKAEAKLAEKRFKKRHAARQSDDNESDEDEGEDDEDEKPITASQLEERLAADRLERQKESQGSEALAIARKNTSSEAEAKAAVLYWKNRVVPTGDLEEDVLAGIAVMNRKRIKGQQSEVDRSKRSKENASTDAASGHQDAPKPGEPKMSAQDKHVIAQAGFVWDGSKRLYRKPLGKDGKKFLNYDVKTSKRWASN